MKTFIFVLMIGLFFLGGCGKTNRNRETTDISVVNQGINTNIISNDINDSNQISSVSNPSILPKVVTQEKNAKEWYIRLVVEDTTNNLISTDAQLGEINAIDTSNYALKAISPFTSRYLDVLFVNPVGVDAGAYKSDFHSASTDADVWEFTVKSFDSSATMILSWKGLYVLTPYTDKQNRTRYYEYRSSTNPLLKYMTLYDVTNGTEVEVLNHGSAQTYVFDMNGSNERVFRWKIKDSSIVAQPKFTSFVKVGATPLSQTEKLHALQVKALRKDAKARPTRLQQQRAQSVDMRQPPLFKVIAP